MAKLASMNSRASELSTMSKLRPGAVSAKVCAKSRLREVPMWSSASPSLRSAGHFGSLAVP